MQIEFKCDHYRASYLRSSIEEHKYQLRPSSSGKGLGGFVGGSKFCPNGDKNLPSQKRDSLGSIC